MADRSKNFNSELQEYANKHSLRLNEFQKEIIDYTMKLGKAISDKWAHINELIAVNTY